MSTEQRYPSEISDKEWELISDHIKPDPLGGRHDRKKALACFEGGKTIRLLFLFFVLISPLMGNEKYVESYMYWAPEINIKDSPLLNGLEKSLKCKKLRNWKTSHYLPWLISWDTVHSWQDFKWWLGWDLPREEALDSETAYCVFWNFGAPLKKCSFKRLPKEKLILILWEPPTVEPEAYEPELWAQFGTVLTWDDDLVDNQKFFKVYYPNLRNRIEKFPHFEEKKFCSMIATRLTSTHPKELYSERLKTIRFFEDKAGEFDLYGGNWEKHKFKNSKGKIPDKIEVLKNYKFNICYENMRDVKGYITEKIFDCFVAGVVPVYWGASNITDYIPKETFIDRREFESNNDLYNYLKSIPKTRYEAYLEAADRFLKSDKAKIFTEQNLIETLAFFLNDR